MDEIATCRTDISLSDWIRFVAKSLSTAHSVCVYQCFYIWPIPAATIKSRKKLRLAPFFSDFLPLTLPVSFCVHFTIHWIMKFRISHNRMRLTHYSTSSILDLYTFEDAIDKTMTCIITHTHLFSIRFSIFVSNNFTLLWHINFLSKSALYFDNPGYFLCYRIQSHTDCIKCFWHLTICFPFFLLAVFSSGNPYIYFSLAQILSFSLCLSRHSLLFTLPLLFYHMPFLRCSLSTIQTTHAIILNWY